MRVVRYDKFGDPDILYIAEVPVPEPGPGQVLIRAEAIGVNFVETQRRRGTAPFPTQLPATPAGDVVGRVEAVGDGVETVRVGDRVAAMVFDGAYADYAVADSAWLVPLPEGLDRAQASVLASPAQAALAALRTGRVGPGDTVLIHAAAGNIGHLAVQLAKILGAERVIGTASTPSKLAFAREHGADVAIDYGNDSWPSEVRAATDGERGVDVVLDSIGGKTLLTGLELLSPFGRLVFFGAASGSLPDVPAMSLIQLNYLVGCGLEHWWRFRPEAARENLHELIDYVASGRLRVSVHAELPLTEAAQAHRIIEDRAQHGRILLIP